MSSVAEVKTDSGKLGSQREEISRDSGGINLQSPSSTVRRRRSRDSQAPLTDALKALTGEDSHSDSGKRVGANATSPTSVPIPGINPLSAMGLGRANLGETAQGWVDSVGSRLAELQKGET